MATLASLLSPSTLISPQLNDYLKKKKIFPSRLFYFIYFVKYKNELLQKK